MVELQPVDVCVNVKVVEPAATPVIIPAFVTVAIEVLLLNHVPPVVGESVAVLPTQTVEADVTTGNALIVTVAVFVN